MYLNTLNTSTCNKIIPNRISEKKNDLDDAVYLDVLFQSFFYLHPPSWIQYLLLFFPYEVDHFWLPLGSFSRAGEPERLKLILETPKTGHKKNLIFFYFLVK